MTKSPVPKADIKRCLTPDDGEEWAEVMVFGVTKDKDGKLYLKAGIAIQDYKSDVFKLLHQEVAKYFETVSFSGAKKKEKKKRG